MCLVIDACSANIIAENSCEPSSIIIAWVRMKGRVVSGGKLQEELGRTKLRSLISTWSAAGKFLVVDQSELEKHIADLKNCTLRSNDVHVVAVARTANAGVVVTGDDLLIADLKDPTVSKQRRRVIKLRHGYSPSKRIIKGVLREAGCG
jgi:predicted nucleic acid-binding protein